MARKYPKILFVNQTTFLLVFFLVPFLLARQIPYSGEPRNVFSQHSKFDKESNGEARDWVFWLGVGANVAQILDFLMSVATGPFEVQ